MFGYALAEFVDQPALILYCRPGSLFGPGTRGGPGTRRRTILPRRDPAQAQGRQPVLVPRFGQGGGPRTSERRHPVDHRGHHRGPPDDRGAGTQHARAVGHPRYGFGGHWRGAQPRLRSLQPPLRGNLRPARGHPGRPVVALAVQQRRGIPARRRAGLRRVCRRQGASARAVLPAPRRRRPSGCASAAAPSTPPIRTPDRSGWPRISLRRAKPRNARARPSKSSRSFSTTPRWASCLRGTAWCSAATAGWPRSSATRRRNCRGVRRASSYLGEDDYQRHGADRCCRW
jgi:hypothetical protein